MCYLPFEGAGAISLWCLSLPQAFRQFDYDAITDVLLHMRYTARDGGAKLIEAASGYVQSYVKEVNHLSATEGLFSLFDVGSDFMSEWFRAIKIPLPLRCHQLQSASSSSLA